MTRAARSAGSRTVLAALLGVAIVCTAFLLGRGTAPERHPRHAPAAPGAADIGFAQDMATHHDQAVLMAGLALTRGGPAVRGIAQGILTGQSQEVGLLRGWLRVWGAPGTSPHPMAWMPSGGMAGMDMSGDDPQMPGMATPPQLQRLYGLAGERFDVLFLQLMIRHHEGGLLMTRAVLDLHVLALTRTAAQGISAEQIEELGTMRALLAADGGKPLAVPSL